MTLLKMKTITQSAFHGMWPRLVRCGAIGRALGHSVPYVFL